VVKKVQGGNAVIQLVQRLLNLFYNHKFGAKCHVLGVGIMPLDLL